MMKKTLAALAAVAALAAFASARPSSAIEISFEEDHSLPLVYLNLAVKAGSVNDPKGKLGLSNFMAEMLLRGTRSKTKEQIDTALDQMGARLEVEVRAEALILRGAALASQAAPFMKLMNEIVTEPSFPEGEIRKLKSEIVSGILEELGHDPSLAGRRFTRFLFRDHPYGNPVLGTVEEVEHLTRDDIVRQYENLIRDKNLLVVGTGDTTQAAVETWSKAIASARPGAGPDGEIKKVDAPSDAPSRRLQIIDKPDRTQTQINLGQIGVKMTDKGFFPLYLGNYAFGGGSFSARLMVEIRVKRGWSYGANSYFRHGLQPRSWTVHLFPASKDTTEALAYALKMVDDLRVKGITQEEYAFSQKSLVNSAGFMYNTPKKRVENKLLERTLDLPDGFMKTYGPELQKVPLADVNAALAKYLKPDRLAISVLCTASQLKEPLAKATGVPTNQVTVQAYTQE